MAEIGELESALATCYNRISKCNEIINDCDRKIARLERAIRTLEDCKLNVEAAISSDTGKLAWVGTRYRETRNGWKEAKNAMKLYLSNLDSACDDLIRKKAEYEQKKAENSSLLGMLFGWVSSIKAEIQALSN